MIQVSGQSHSQAAVPVSEDLKERYLVTASKWGISVCLINQIV
jgi:hypothetical protein